MTVILGTNGDTTGTLISLATPSTAGLMSAAQAAAFASPGTGFVIQAYLSPKIDFTKTGQTAFTSMPHGAGTIFLSTGTTTPKVIYTTDTASVGPTFGVGNNSGTWANYLAVQAVAVNANASPSYLNLQSVSNAAFVDLGTTPMTVNVTVAATGGALSGYVVIYGAVVTTPTP